MLKRFKRILDILERQIPSNLNHIEMLEKRIYELEQRLSERKPLTENEDRAVARVASMPGSTAREIGRAMAIEANKWNSKPGEEPSGYDIERETKFVYNAFMKGALTRVRDGAQWRYDVVR